MKRYDEKILGLLLDRYEGSLLYTGDNRVRVSITVKLTKSVIPEYFDQTGTEYIAVDEQLRGLERAGLIRIICGRINKHIIEKCELNIDEAEKAYKMLKRIPRREKEYRLKQLLCGLKEKAKEAYSERASEKEAAERRMYEFTLRYIDSIEERLLSGKSIKADVDMDNPEELKYICRLLNAIEGNTEECFLREFSLRTFHDTKTAEKYMPRAIGIIRRLAGKTDIVSLNDTAAPDALTAAADMSDEEILEEFNIYKNPSWIMLKGCGRLKIGETTASLGDMPSGLGLAGADIDKISWDRELIPQRVLTIENLTSFHRWRDKGRNTLCIYLGGYANGYRRSLLKKLRECYHDSEFMHFGDIDCGGFYIWRALCEETGIDFKTVGMDIETYLKACAEGRPLTENDRRALERMREDDFFSEQRELFSLMLERGIKTEQEGVELK